MTVITTLEIVYTTLTHYIRLLIYDNV